MPFSACDSPGLSKGLARLATQQQQSRTQGKVSLGYRGVHIVDLLFTEGSRFLVNSGHLAAVFQMNFPQDPAMKGMWDETVQLSVIPLN